MGELNHPAHVGDDDVLRRGAHLLGHFGVGLEVALLAVDRDKELGPNQGVDDLQLVLAGVAGDVEGAGVLADHLGLFPVQFVDDIVDGALVAGDGGGGDDHPVPGLDLHLLVGGEGDAEEGGHGLALAAGGDDAHLVLGQGLDVVDVHHDPFGDVGVPQFGGHPHGVLHAPAGDGHFPAIAGGHVDDLLDSVHVGGEGGDDDPLLAALEELVEAGPHGRGAPRWWSRTARPGPLPCPAGPGGSGP